MEILYLNLLLKIFIAHFLSDFVLQPTKWALEKDKNGFKSWHLYLHFLITISILFLIIWDFNFWKLLITISIFHLFIDSIKCRIKISNSLIFIADQLLHILVIIISWILFTNQTETLGISLLILIDNSHFWLILLAYILLTIPSSVLIGKLANYWNNELNEVNNNKGLVNAGKWIGIIERILIFTFILVNQISIIGFLLAAKSVFRFGELKDSKDQKKTEYIIIGTLFSFAIASIMGLVIRLLI